MTTELDKLYEALINKCVLINNFSIPHGGWLPRDFSPRGGWSWGRDNKTAKVYRNADGKYHRLYGPAIICEDYAIELWYKDGVFHREDGPAVTHKDTSYWVFNGLLHCLSGPAVISPVLPKTYWINGQQLSPKEYKKEINRRKRKGLIK